MSFYKKFLRLTLSTMLIAIPSLSSAQYVDNFTDRLSEENQNVLRKLGDDNQVTRSFVRPTVENNTQLMIVWGDINNNVDASVASETTANLSISTDKGRIFAKKPIRKEINDLLTSERISDQLQISSKLYGGVDGLVIAINENANTLNVDFGLLSDTTYQINISDFAAEQLSLTGENRISFTNEDKTIGFFVQMLPPRENITLNDEDFRSRKSFNDTDQNQWYHKYVETISDKRVDGSAIFEGYKDANGNLTGNFGPADNLRLGELIKIALVVGGHTQSESNLESDLQGLNHWSRGYLNTGKKLRLRILNSSNLNPDRFVSRGEFFQTILEASGIVTPNNIEAVAETCVESKLEAFSDYNVSNRFNLAACILIQDGAISGTSDGFLKLDENINRAEVAKVVIEVLSKYKENTQQVENEVEKVLENLNDEEASQEENSETNPGEAATYEGPFELTGLFTVENSAVYANAVNQTSNLPVEVENETGIFTNIKLTNSDIETLFNVDFSTQVQENCSYGGEIVITIENLSRTPNGEFEATITDATLITTAEITCF